MRTALHPQGGDMADALLSAWNSLAFCDSCWPDALDRLK